MSTTQLGGAIALAVVGLLLIVISAISRDGISGTQQSQLGDHLSKLGLFMGGFFMCPLVIILLVSIVVGFRE